MGMQVAFVPRARSTQELSFLIARKKKKKVWGCSGLLFFSFLGNRICLF